MRCSEMGGLKMAIVIFLWMLAVVMCPVNTNAYAVSLCGKGEPATNPANHHQYCLTSKMTWMDAQRKAQSVDGNLVTINSSEENDWLVQTFGGTDALWIGISDLEKKGTYKWVSGEPVTYKHWEQYNPSSGSQCCGYMNYKGAGQWDDLAGNSQLAGIVELNQIVFPDTVLNLDSVANASKTRPFSPVNESTPVQVELPIGTYRISVIGKADGGQYDAWNRNNGKVENCTFRDIDLCAKGWENKYVYDLAGQATIVEGLDDRHNTPERALESKPEPQILTLTEPDTITFYINEDNPDPRYGNPKNNLGGVSLKIAKL